MSIMLRKECQKVLDKAGYSNLHANIHPKTKTLGLFTPCGKPFAPVHGVLFSRLQPTIAEIDYTVELLSTWLQRNTKLIEDYVEARAELEATPKPSKDGDEYELITAGDWKTLNGIRTYVHEVCALTIGKEFIVPKKLLIDSEHDPRRQIIWTIKLNTTLSSITWTGYLPQEVYKEALTIPQDLLELANKKAAEYQNYLDLQHEVERLQAELNSCED